MQLHGHSQSDYMVMANNGYICSLQTGYMTIANDSNNIIANMSP